MLTENLHRLPRSYVGDKGARITAFLSDYLFDITSGDVALCTAHHCVVNTILNLMRTQRPPVNDIGGLMRVPRKIITDALVPFDATGWIDSIEDVLDFSFPVPDAIRVASVFNTGNTQGNVEHHQQVVVAKAGYRAPAYATSKDLEEAGLGATLLAAGQLDEMQYKLTRQWFPKIVTGNPLIETITNPEVQHINDVLWET